MSRLALLSLSVVALCPLMARAQTAVSNSSSLIDQPITGQFSLSSSANTASQNSAAKFASGTGTLLFLGAGTLLPLLEDGPEGREHTLRTMDSLLTSTLITEGLKHIVREKRPDGSDRTSFPSGHATAAFAVATMQSHFHPKQAPYWYAGATLISYSRVKLNRHYYHDVIAGAAVGYFTSRWELSQRRGLILSPLIRSRNAGGNGVSVSMNF